EVTIKRDGENASYVVPIERVILMQSTGLFDKNGVEIFDGDIVKLQYTIASDFELFEVRQFRGGMWRIDNRRRGSDLWLRNEDCEVIGNIYQNSDLIESVEE
ncbi:YopX family protein, partial [Streptococcus pyogenes]